MEYFDLKSSLGLDIRIPEYALLGFAFLITLGTAMYFGGVTAPFHHLVSGILNALAFGVVSFYLLKRQALPQPVTTWLCIALLILLWGAFQVVPLPYFLQWLGNPLWSQASQLLETSLPARISVTPYEGWNGILTGTALAGWGIIIAYLTTQVGAEKVLKALGIAGTLICLYGYIVYVIGNGYVLYLPKLHYLDSLTSTFINRNTFATYAGLTFLINISLFLLRVGEIPSRSRTSLLEYLNALYKLTFQRRWIWLLAAAFVFITLVLSDSRAGLAWSLVGVFVMFSTLIIRLKIRYGWVLITSFICFSLLVLGVIGAKVGQRLTQVDEDMSARAGIYQTTLEAWKDSPFIGTGLGSFEEVFRIYRPSTLTMGTNIRIEKAHSTPLQLLLELGTLGMLAIGSLLIFVTRTLLRGVKNRRREVIYPIMGISVLSLAVGHSFFDFSLQIPAVMVMVVALLSVACTKSYRSQELVSLQAYQMALYGGVAVLFVFASLASFKKSWESYHVNTLVSERANMKESVSVGKLNKIRKDLMEWVSVPSANRELAYIYADLSQRSKNKAMASIYAASSGLYAQKFLEINPADPYMWYRMSVAHSRLDNVEKARAFWFISQKTGVWEPLIWAQIPYMRYVYAHSTREEQTVIRQKINVMWKLQPFYVWSMYKQDTPVLDFMACMIQDDADAVEKLKKLEWKPIDIHLKYCNN